MDMCYVVDIHMLGAIKIEKPMRQIADKILLNEILKLDDLENVKIRFNLMFGDNWNPIEIL